MRTEEEEAWRAKTPSGPSPQKLPLKDEGVFFSHAGANQSIFMCTLFTQCCSLMQTREGMNCPSLLTWARQRDCGDGHHGTRSSGRNPCRVLVERVATTDQFISYITLHVHASFLMFMTTRPTHETVCKRSIQDRWKHEKQMSTLADFYLRTLWFILKIKLLNCLIFTTVFVWLMT